MTPTGIKTRVCIVTALGLTPVVFLTGVGVYHLYDTGWSYIAYWPMAASFFASYALAWYWTRRKTITPDTLPDTGEKPAEYWTDRDREAWKLVESHAIAAGNRTTDDMADFQQYAKDAEELALKITRLYHPSAKDPFGHLTLPEVLACGELVSQDMSELVENYVPGSHLLTVNDWKRARDTAETVADWYPRVRNVYWLVSAVFNPLKTATQVAMTKGGLAPVFKQVQQNMLLWFHTAYVHRLGRYLIELNSGRLKVGAKRYRELLAKHMVPPTDPTTNGQQPPVPEDVSAQKSDVPPSPVPEANLVSVTIVGPVKAGKSSLVNAILGEQKAATDVLPLTLGATRYTLRQPGLPTLTLIDTAGYGNEGATDADLASALVESKNSDILILATPARSAARKPEVEFLDKLKAAFSLLPHLRMPPVLVAITHADLLTPAAEWSPPYDWRTGTRPKERTMHEAVAAAREQFAGRALDVIPLAAAPDRIHGVRDDLLPAIAKLLGDGRGVGLLRALHAEAEADRTKRVVKQVLNTGQEVLRALWDSAKKG